MSRLLVRTHNYNIKHDTLFICLVFKNMRWMCALTQIQIHYAHNIYTHIHIITFNLYKKQKQKVPTMIRMGVIFPSWYTPNYLRGSDPCSVSSLSTRHFGKVRAIIYVCMHFYPIIYSTTTYIVHWMYHACSCIVWDVIAYLVWVVIYFHLTTFF